VSAEPGRKFNRKLRWLRTLRDGVGKRKEGIPSDPGMGAMGARAPARGTRMNRSESMMDTVEEALKPGSAASAVSRFRAGALSPFLQAQHININGRHFIRDSLLNESDAATAHDEITVHCDTIVQSRS
jgi:hypothetical protein